MNLRSISIAPLLIFALALSPLGAQTPTVEPSKDALVFSIRSAFSLTAGMLASLQAKQGESAAMKSTAMPGIEIPWTETLVRTVPLSLPLDVKLMGSNVATLVQILPLGLRGNTADLLIQGQVWIKMPDGSVSFNTSVQTLAVNLGSRVFFYPLGMDSKTGAPIALEIKVERP
jgi:hypothetical protein